MAPDGVWRRFEREAIRMLAEDALDAAQLQALLDWRGDFDCEHTGVGYFLTMRDPALPEERAVMSLPGLSGCAGPHACGFVLFLGDHELTLECHTWDGSALPADFRERAVQVRLTPGEIPIF
jgi:hypothetical protein